MAKAARFFRDVLLERECYLAGPRLAGPAEDDDELAVPVVVRALPAVLEPLSDPLEEGFTRSQTVGPMVVLKAFDIHRQDREHPTLGELPPQNMVQRRAVR